MMLLLLLLLLSYFLGDISRCAADDWWTSDGRLLLVDGSRWFAILEMLGMLGSASTTTMCRLHIHMNITKSRQGKDEISSSEQQ